MHVAIASSLVIHSVVPHVVGKVFLFVSSQQEFVMSASLS